MAVHQAPLGDEPEIENQAQDDDENASDEGDMESNDEMEETDEKSHGMAGMGDVIAKILAKSLSKNSTILSKSQKTTKRKLQIKEEIQAKKEKLELKKEQRERNHAIPNRSNAQKEILLKRIATKGVVKLFNAVSAHQKEISDKMKGAKTEAKKDKVSEKVKKSTFMDLLKKPNSTNNKTTNDEKESQPGETKKWDVLRDDFMMSASMKDWDKNERKNEEEEETDDDGDGESLDSADEET